MPGVFFIRHTIGATKITAVDDRNAQIAQRSMKSILKKIFNHQIICVSRISYLVYEIRATRYKRRLLCCYRLYFIQSALHRMPGKTRAFDARREMPDTGKNRKLA